MALIGDIFKGVGEFVQGAAQAVPGTVKRANDFAIQAKNVAVREQANQLQQKSIDGLNKNREQQRNLASQQMTMKAMSTSNVPMRNFIIDSQVKNGEMSKDFGDGLKKTSDEAQLFAQEALADGKITSAEIQKIRMLGGSDALNFFLDMEAKGVSMNKVKADTALAEEKTAGLKRQRESGITGKFTKTINALMASLTPEEKAGKTGQQIVELALQKQQKRRMDVFQAEQEGRIEAKKNAPLPASDLKNLILPDGSRLPVGTTQREAEEKGAIALSSATIDQISNNQSLTQTTARLGLLANKIFTNDTKGLLGVVRRLAGAPSAIVKTALQADPDFVEYQSQVEGFLALFARAFGEKGVLTEGDTGRARGLFPKVFPIMDTKEVKDRKLKNIDSQLLVLGNLLLKKQGKSTFKTLDKALENGSSQNKEAALAEARRRGLIK